MRNIYKSAIRDIWFSRSRSFAIVIAIIIVVAFPIAFLNLAPNLGATIDKEEKQYKLSYFDVIYSETVNKSVGDKLQKVLSESSGIPMEEITVENRVYTRSRLKTTGTGELDEGTWLPIDLILQEEPKISIPKLTSGKFAKGGEDIVLLESYAKADGLELGDNITIYGKSGPINYTLVGTVKAVEFSSFQISQIAAGYLTEEGYERFYGRPLGEKRYTDTLVYFESEPDLETMRKMFDDAIKAFAEDPSTPDIALMWFSRETSFRQGLKDSLDLTSQYMLVAASFIFVVAAIVIYVVMNRSVNEQKKVLGAMYAFGNTKLEILFANFVKVTLLGILGVAGGLVVSKLTLNVLIDELGESWGLVETQSVINTGSLVFTLMSTAAVVYGSSLLAMMNIFRLTPYEAMRGKTSELKSRGLVYSVVKYIPVRTLRVSLRNLTRSRTRTVLTVLAFTTALTFAWSLYYTDKSMNYTVDEFYDNRVFYDVDISFSIYQSVNSTFISGLENMDGVTASEPFFSALVSFDAEPENIAYMQGIRAGTEMMDLSDANIYKGRWFHENSSEVVVSQYIAGKYGVQMGENLTLVVFGQKVNATVVGVTNDMLYTLSLWIDLDYLSSQIHLFPYQVDTVYNRLLLKYDGDVHELQNRLNTEREDIVIVKTKDYYQTRMSVLVNTQAAIIYMMSSLGLLVGSVAVFSTFLISIVEREREVALLRVFGKSRVEVGVQIMVEGIALVLLALSPAYFAAKWVASNLWLDIVRSTIFIPKEYFPTQVDLFVVGYALMTALISVFFSYYSASKIPIVDGIREE